MRTSESLTADNLEHTLVETCTGMSEEANPIPPRRVEPSDPAAGTVVRLPAAQLPGAVQMTAASLDIVLRRRAAARRFESSGLDAERFGTVLVAAQSSLSDCNESSAVRLSLYVHAWRTLNFPHACYRYDGSEHLLRHVAPQPPPEDRNAMCRQIEFADAAAVLVIAGDLEHALSRYGDHGYRLLLLRGGSALHRCWVEATRVGLVGCLCEAPFQRANGHSTYQLRCGEIPLLALALGEPATCLEEKK
jgi:hypothetical protein